MSMENPKPITRKGKWSDAEIIRSALSYSDIKTFRTEQPRHYAAIARRGLQECMGHMVKLRGPAVVWTPDTLAVEALKYNTRKEFQKGNNSAYTVAKRIGVYDSICGHMEVKWVERTDAEIVAAASRFTSLQEFQEKARSFYTLANRRGMIGREITHLVRPSVWTIQNIKAEAGKYRRRSDFFNGASGAVAAAKRLGNFEEICSHMGKPWGDRTKWSDEYLHLVARACKTKAELILRGKNEYQAIYRRGLIASACAHMVKYAPDTAFGFQPLKPASLYLVAIHSRTEPERVGFGITQNPKRRIGLHRRNLARCGYGMTVIGVTEPTLGHDARALETLLYEGFEPYGVDVPGFKRECTKAEHLGELLDIVEAFATLGKPDY